MLNRFTFMTFAGIVACAALCATGAEKYKKMIRDDLKSGPKPTKQPHGRADDIDHPKRGTDGTPKLRVLIASHKRSGHSKGQFTALGSHPIESLEETVEFKEKKTTLNPQPDIAIYSGWLYVIGDSPVVGTRSVVAQAEGCEIVLQHWEEGGQHYCRAYYLEGDPDELVLVYPQKAGEKTAVLTAGTVVDAEVNAAGDFVKWRGVALGAEPAVELHDSGKAPWTNINRAIDDARRDEEVG